MFTLIYHFLFVFKYCSRLIIQGTPSPQSVSLVLLFFFPSPSDLCKMCELTQTKPSSTLSDWFEGSCCSKGVVRDPLLHIS